MADALLRLHRATVPPEWVDFNGHMNDAAYAIVFSHATDAFMDAIGLDAAWRARSGATIYTLESHICYLREALQGEALATTTQLLGHDSKRLRVFHVLYRVGEPEPLATSEQMLLHVDRAGPRATPFAPGIAAAIGAILRRQAGLPLPEQAGRSIRRL